MSTADDFDVRMRTALRRHIERVSSISQAARELGISKSTLHDFLYGNSDTGFRRSWRWAEKQGLPPIDWIQEAGAFPELESHSDAIRRAIEIRPPEDSQLLDCLDLATKLSIRLPSQLLLPQVVLTIEDMHLEDPQAASAFAAKCVKNKLRQLRQAQRKREQIAPEDLVDFFALVGSYGLCCCSKTSPIEWAWCIAFALDYFQRAGPSPPLTWFVIDGSMALRRLFKPEIALSWAREAAGASLLQDTHRLYPRALLALASACFYSGDYKSGTANARLVLETRVPNPYQTIAASSAVVALSRVDANEANQLLSDYRDRLDLLPAHCQLQRLWTEARVKAEIGAKEQAFDCYLAAIGAGTANADARDFFLIFDEARRLVDRDDPRLESVSKLLGEQLIRMSYDYPDEYYAAEQYLKFLREKDDDQLLSLIRTIGGIKDGSKMGGRNACSRPHLRFTRLDR